MPQFAVAWQRLRQLQEEDATLEATVMSVNRGGLLVEAASLRGFIPTSHVSVVRQIAEKPCTRAAREPFSPQSLKHGSQSRAAVA